MVQVDPGADDPPHVVHVSTFAGRDDRDATEPVAQGQVGVRGEQRLEHPHAAGDAGDQPGAVPLIVLSVWVGAQHHQQAGDIEPIVRRRQ